MIRQRAPKTPCPHGVKRKHECQTCKAEFNKAYRAKNLEKLKAYDKIYSPKYYQQNRTYHLVSVMNRRAKNLGVEGFITVEFYDSVINNPCTYCKQVGLPMELDHRIPIAKGGNNWPENLQALCRYCNKAKHWYGEEDFLGWLNNLRKAS